MAGQVGILTDWQKENERRHKRIYRDYLALKGDGKVADAPIFRLLAKKYDYTNPRSIQSVVYRMRRKQATDKAT